jgi:hypothetical protein
LADVADTLAKLKLAEWIRRGSRWHLELSPEARACAKSQSSLARRFLWLPVSSALRMRATVVYRDRLSSVTLMKSNLRHIPELQCGRFKVGG